jgi:hypothetical protein
MTPTGLGSIGIASVSCGRRFTLVLLEDGHTVRAFGDNPQGQLATGDTADQLSPVSFGAGVADVVEIHGGDIFSCISFSDGRIQCVGNDSDQEFNFWTGGQLGDGGSNSDSLVLVDVLNLPTESGAPTSATTLVPTSMPTTTPTTSVPTSVPTTTPTATPTYSPSLRPSTGVIIK